MVNQKWQSPIDPPSASQLAELHRELKLEYYEDDSPANINVRFDDWLIKALYYKLEKIKLLRERIQDHINREEGRNEDSN